MKPTFQTGLVVAGLALAAALTAPVQAADLNGPSWGGRGSIKDEYAMAAPSPAGPCYVRANVGYSISNDPTLRWNAVDASNNINETVSNTSMGNSWLAEGGSGCGSGSRGMRAELMLGYRGERSVEGITAPFSSNNNSSSRIQSKLSTYTLMSNFYYDLGRVGAFVPYLGAGVGIAYHRAANYTLPDWTSANPPDYGVSGANDLSLAWSLMAGVGYQISDRAIIDLGYRYIDLGSAATARNDVGGGAQVTRLQMDNLTAHEFMLGLRYHFGGASSCCASVAMK